MEPEIIILPDEEATKQLGRRLASQLTPNSVLLLQGDLGAGKTTLVQGLGQALGITEPILSPTFTLINEYPEARIPLYHVDLYRLTPDQVQLLHLENYWQAIDVPPGITAIEWANLLPQLPPHYYLVTLQILHDFSRKASIIRV
ncbi:MAG: tRNA (adenosine(37)-N6)-threonylcarbamoyltransferase complex ATPase subunit type 1 TsaE [Geminocystis sp.]|nr:tRNA (adenosine(37)-N6)-threonylcarbamoyltransferase complex ATPase subunit type 1 TsaE [Geminocystis sp.]HIK37668.1 tRNA (adenosine(37)-N6)-threonylcarbamoyltransferase complex ATPase subunit type 1 TsaE [Geminocystis sp. M7585_C2015_104]MCS7148776.1 tRNA (adenosine(37)-N6)-threonylcarbamoyltransferase complex ATPase subunit type 1 TsaE [Geminocystis sp.]MCX8078678.1 tRNA (adenosine(37)-N6)-threonylcarbamoyltransferase complex ATPase subunit type 1 TsaE [Geminocystis sp.]MDW8115386.1 tRNA (